jgi:hypothetical protein
MQNQLHQPTIMMRSIFITFCLVILATQLEEIQGLAAIVRRFRCVGFWGRRSTQRTTRLHPIQVNAQAPTDMARDDSIPPTVFASFDADAYRREMTDLVYQRNMERLHVN